MTKSCGFNAGKIKPFRTNFLQAGGKKPFFEENSWRKIARPGAKGQCAASEEYDEYDGTCIGMYGLQMYPTARTGTANHYLVENATPMMRVLPKESFPGANDRCRFDVDSALIFVAGVNNPYLGETWNTTDGELLASMLAWM